MVPSVAFGFVVVGGSAAAAVLGLLLVRALVPERILDDSHFVASVKLQVIGTLYAVLLGFLVVMNWQAFQSAEQDVAREANKLGDIFRDAQGCPSPFRERLREQIQAYVQLVIAQEWDAMTRGESSPEAHAAIHRVWTTLFEMRSQAPREDVLYAELLRRMNEMNEARRARLYASQSAFPPALWTLLIVGGIITVGFSWLLGGKNLMAQALMTTAFAGLIALFIFLVLLLEYPFRGAARIGPEPFQVMLDMWKALPY